MWTRRDGIFGIGSDSFLGFFRAERKAEAESFGEDLEQKALFSAHEYPKNGMKNITFGAESSSTLSLLVSERGVPLIAALRA